MGSLNTVYLNNKKFIDQKVQQKEYEWKSKCGGDWVLIEEMPEEVFDQMRSKWQSEVIEEYNLN